ncbi:MAG: type IX secretion system outer membrane channel protein PorV, partial [Flavobacteriaceae bacterium]|nr:type IX secretion system outer membrane channel protein PorV [Flavobacteriaceae bacterium]MCB0475102.1 type IX secretion system outer membrane channel protein PorV [Flavobacteriaceae bacterium]
MKLYLSILFIFLLTITKLDAQVDRNPITTAAPFLLIAPDARAGGMGDIGIATSADANSYQYNAAKYAFMESQYAIGFNITPWLRQLTNDVYKGTLRFANRLDEKSAWSFGLDYFTLGKIETNSGVDPNTNELISTGVENPYDLALSGTYSLKLSESFAMSVGLRYLHSDYSIKSSDDDIQRVNTFSVDVSGFYQSAEKNYGSFNGIWRGGFNISNVGPKVELVAGGTKSYIPTNLKLGGGFEFVLDDLNSITTNLEFNKLLVPTPSEPITNTDDEVIGYRQKDVGFLAGMFQSFGDAPGGFSEELKEFTWAFGAEYMYDNTMGLRAGYFNESDFKGGRKYFTLGAGFKFNAITLDLSYLINSSDVNNPLENTLRFSLSFNFGDTY